MKPLLHDTNQLRMSFSYIIQDWNVGQNSVAKLFFITKNFTCLAPLNVNVRLINSLHSLYLTSLNRIQDFFLWGHREFMNHFFFFLVFREESACTQKTPRHLSFYRVYPLASIKEEPKILGVLRNCGIGAHVFKEYRLNTNLLFSLIEHLFFCVLQKTQIVTLFRCWQFLWKLLLVIMY